MLPEQRERKNSINGTNGSRKQWCIYEGRKQVRYVEFKG